MNKRLKSYLVRPLLLQEGTNRVVQEYIKLHCYVQIVVQLTHA